ncbi:sensor histidine kinase [Archangium sp.]|uniref:sensor histidine kinase n=1 Tax=Archangium sp. TaxID=1872627 RepID=UPI002D465356|nr:ATP-binding protein [Archangium sp.]HYO51979.1 ATP-binding protein [Archangium sp.]
MSASRSAPLSSALSVGLPVLASLTLQGFAGEAKWEHEPLQSALETAGGLIALAMAALLLWRRQYPGHAPHFEWVATALVCMGLQDLSHACVRVSPGFFWSRALPTLLGGLLIALVWLPERWARSRAARRLPLLVGLLTLPLCAAFIFLPWAWPRAFSADGNYTTWAKLLNMAGGAGFLASAAFFLGRYRREGGSEHLVFANHCLLFGVAGLLFGLSHLWGAIWWLFHALRLLAYLVVLRYVVEVYRGLQSAQEAALMRKLEQKEAQMRLVTDALPVLVSFIQRDGRYGYINRAYTEWFGLSPEQILGRHFRDILSDVAYDTVHPLIERSLAGEALSFERELPYVHGQPRSVRASYMPHRDARGQVEGMVALVQDITAEKRARERAERLQAVTSALSRALTPEDVARAVLAEATEGLGVGSGTFYGLEAEGGRLRLLHLLGLPAGVVAGYEEMPLEAPMPIAAVVRSGEPEWLETPGDMVRRFPAMQAVLRVSTNQAWAALPLLGRSGPLGALLLGFGRPRSFDAEDRAFLLALSQQAAQALERANLYRAAQLAVRVREDFLSVAGHELRTPLTSLKLQLHLLSRTLSPGLREKSASRLSVIGRQVGRLESLVASLLDVGRLSAGRLELELGEMDLSALTREVLERLADVFEQAGCEVHLEAGAPVQGVWDAQRLDQVLVNLLTNAAKYGAGRPVHVRVEEAAGGATLTVRDEGIGIPAEALPRLFGRFERAVSEREYGGLGLGLYISRQLVEAMGGRVRVDSRPGEGATFTVELPLRPAVRAE